MGKGVSKSHITTAGSPRVAQARATSRRLRNEKMFYNGKKQKAAREAQAKEAANEQAEGSGS